MTAMWKCLQLGPITGAGYGHVTAATNERALKMVETVVSNPSTSTFIRRNMGTKGILNAWGVVFLNILGNISTIKR
jgi:hypothetical protein